MEQPKGQAQVKAALIDAAADLYAAGGDFSVRAIARLAGVNHGLVHHYFGSKENLQASMLDHLAARIDARIGTAQGPDGDSLEALVAGSFQAMREDPRFLKILARSLLEGVLPERFQQSYPVVQRMVGAMRASGASDPEVLVAAGLAAGLGWHLFAPWICQAAGLDDAQVTALEALLSKPPGE